MLQAYFLPFGYQAQLITDLPSQLRLQLGGPVNGGRGQGSGLAFVSQGALSQLFLMFTHKGRLHSFLEQGLCDPETVQ